jgi:hypothetical protein
MNFIQFVFSFLYVRDWNTGRHELSRERLTLFCFGVFLVLLGLLMATIMQAPVQYESPLLESESAR